MENKSYKPSKKLTTADGTIMYTFDGKLHNWEGPALIPEGVSRKGEYYLYGIPMSKDDWKEAISQQSGLPWYKKPAAKGQNHRN